jgi:hypothetical protein
MLVQGYLGPILKIFSPKNLAKNLTFCAYNTDIFCTLVSKKNAIVFAENCEKLLKIVIITLTPGTSQPVLNNKIAYAHCQPFIATRNKSLWDLD